MKKIILTIIVLISIIFGVFMYQKNDYVHSEAVFVATDSLTNVAFKVDGKILKMTKEEGDLVTKGEILATLETDILNTKLKEIGYKIKSLNHNLNTVFLKKEKLLKELNIKKENSVKNIKSIETKQTAFEYQIKANEAKLKKLKFDRDKFFKLYKSNKVSFDKYQQLNTEYKYLLNIINSQKEELKNILFNLEIAKNNLQLVKNEFKNIKILDENIKILNNDIGSLEEAKKELLIKLKDSVLKAPFDGIIAKKFLNKASVIQKGTFIYSIVNPKDIYIKVLLSERKLANVKIGNKALIKLDAFDDEMEGKVEKIMPVSASTFSLVPRDIASGEFTKLDQRFIVKIKIPYNPKLRIGMGAEVKIYKDNK